MEADITEQQPYQERQPTPYQAMGGRATFERLVARFYTGVAADPVLRPLYPEEDLGPAAVRLTLFLEQYWGGPRTYSEERGHPRLRMRHAPFAVTPLARDHWLAHMRDAVDELALDPAWETVLWDYLVSAAYSMVNTFEDEVAPGARSGGGPGAGSGGGPGAGSGGGPGVGSGG